MPKHSQFSNIFLELFFNFQEPEVVIEDEFESPDKPLSPSERVLFGSLVFFMYSVFIVAVCLTANYNQWPAGPRFQHWLVYRLLFSDNVRFQIDRHCNQKGNFHRDELCTPTAVHCLSSIIKLTNYFHIISELLLKQKFRWVTAWVWMTR